MSEYFPSSSVLSGSELEKQVKELLPVTVAEIKQKLELLEKDTPNLEMWRELDEVSESAVIEFYRSKTGIEIDPSTQPDTYFLTDSNMTKMGFDPNGADATPNISSITCAVSPDYAINYLRLVAPFHERFHFTGRAAITGKITSQKGFQRLKSWLTGTTNVTVDAAQLGFFTFGNQERGDCLEESVTHYYSENILLSEDNPRIVDIRKKHFFDYIQIGGVSDDTKEFIESIASMEAEEFIAFEKEQKRSISGVHSERASSTYQLWETILDRADRIGIREEFEKQTLITRFNPNNTRRFFDLLTEVVGDRKLAQKIYAMNSKDIPEILGVIATLSI